jgi:hypothetical protein
LGVGYFALLVTKFGDCIEQYFDKKYEKLYEDYALKEEGDGMLLAVVILLDVRSLLEKPLESTTSVVGEDYVDFDSMR